MQLANAAAWSLLICAAILSAAFTCPYVMSNRMQGMAVMLTAIYWGSQDSWRPGHPVAVQAYRLQGAGFSLAKLCLPARHL